VKKLLIILIISSACVPVSLSPSETGGWEGFSAYLQAKEVINEQDNTADLTISDTAWAIPGRYLDTTPVASWGVAQSVLEKIMVCSFQ